ncbi:hypothetical protein HDU80_000635 [Chytriomyces hyalinus]|nr:hypothetical protein HDU80_000635 [Chytriomyces hyalinus]
MASRVQHSLSATEVDMKAVARLVAECQRMTDAAETVAEEVRRSITQNTNCLSQLRILSKQIEDSSLELQLISGQHSVSVAPEAIVVD